MFLNNKINSCRRGWISPLCVRISFITFVLKTSARRTICEVKNKNQNETKEAIDLVCSLFTLGGLRGPGCLPGCLPGLPANPETQWHFRPTPFGPHLPHRAPERVDIWNVGYRTLHTRKHSARWRCAHLPMGGGCVQFADHAWRRLNGDPTAKSLTKCLAIWAGTSAPPWYTPLLVAHLLTR